MMISGLVSYGTQVAHRILPLVKKFDYRFFGFAGKACFLLENKFT